MFISIRGNIMQLKLFILILGAIFSGCALSTVNVTFEAQSVNHITPSRTKIVSLTDTNPNELIDCPPETNGKTVRWFFITAVEGYSSTNGNELGDIPAPGCPNAQNKVAVGDVVDSLLSVYGGIGVWLNNASFSTYEPGYKICITQGVGAREPVPVFACQTFVTAAVTCSIPGEINFNHGSISGSQINNHSITNAVQIDCDGETNALLNITSSDGSNGKTISLGGGINSKFLIDNVDSSGVDGVSVSLSSGVNTINISSILSSSGTVSAGSYSGQGILTIAPQ